MDRPARIVSLCRYETILNLLIISPTLRARRFARWQVSYGTSTGQVTCVTFVHDGRHSGQLRNTDSGGRQGGSHAKG